MNAFFVLFCLLSSPLICKAAISYDFSGGRFGDNLLSYIHARWISYSKGLPFVYRPFPYSSLLELHREISKKKYRSQIKLHLQESIPSFEITQLLICPYFAEEDLYGAKNCDFFRVDWKNPEFRCFISQLIAPKKSISVIRPDPHSINVALHFREGGGFDSAASYQSQPKKFPPFAFYEKSLHHLLTLFPLAPIHCHIFTDALFSQEFVQKLHPIFSSYPSLRFTYRKDNNRHDQNILEDFFSFFNFDILIRPDSNFSLIPSLIHDFAMVYSPKEFCLREGVPEINRIQVETHASTIHQIIDRTGVSCVYLLSDLFVLECGSDHAQNTLPPLLPESRDQG